MKKLLSILLAMCLVFSLCTIAITSVSAEELTYNDLGISDGTDKKLYDDPTGTGEKVLSMHAVNNRPNVEIGILAAAAAAEDKTAKWQPTTGTVYTVMFDYYLASTSNAKSFDFSLYYGTQSGYILGTKVTVNGQQQSGISKDFIGDNKWHTAAITFTAYDAKGTGDYTETVLPYIYLTYYTTATLNGYLKNIKVVEETGAYSNTVLDWNTKASNGAAYPKYGQATSTFTSATVQGANLIIVPGVTKTPAAIGAATWSNVLVPFATTSDPYFFHPDTTYVVTVRYKVDKYVGACWIGIGTQNNDVGGLSPHAKSGSGRTYCWAKKQIVTATDGWESITGTVSGLTADTFLKLLVCGSEDTTLTIADIEIAAIADGMTNAVFTTYNDNGQPFVRAEYVGTDIAVSGRNTDNAAMGEKFLGWCSDSQLATPITTVPAVASAVYAKYPTIINDFNHMIQPTSPLGVNAGGGVSAAQQHGILRLTLVNNVGAMLFSYDAAVQNQFYKFENGKKYIITYYYQSADAADTTVLVDMKLRHTLASSAGVSGGRDTNHEHGELYVPASTTYGEYTASNFSSVSFTITGSTTATMDGICIRGSKTAFLRLDKITITDMSLVEAQVDNELVAQGSKRDEGTDEQTGEYVSAGIRFKGRVSADFRESASEIGFYAVPTAALNGASIEDYLASANTSMALSAKVKADDMEEVVYAVSTDNYGRKSYDYQLIITGLTREGVDVNLLGTEITCVMYAVVGDETVYTNTMAYSYNDVAAKQ